MSYIVFQNPTTLENKTVKTGFNFGFFFFGVLYALVKANWNAVIVSLLITALMLFHPVMIIVTMLLHISYAVFYNDLYIDNLLATGWKKIDLRTNKDFQE